MSDQVSGSILFGRHDIYEHRYVIRVCTRNVLLLAYHVHHTVRDERHRLRVTISITRNSDVAQGSRSDSRSGEYGEMAGPGVTSSYHGDGARRP